jgi:hypothetical protein
VLKQKSFFRHRMYPTSSFFLDIKNNDDRPVTSGLLHLAETKREFPVK